MLIDTLIINKADYDQPYPDIELEFSSLEGQPIAERMLTPSEYLGGNISSKDLMPSGTPVHIDIEIQNPGPEAVTRQIYLRSNQ